MYQAIVQEKAHKYVCESPDKARVLSFVEWMLDGLTGTVDVTIQYRQNDMPQQVKPQ